MFCYIIGQHLSYKVVRHKFLICFTWVLKHLSIQCIEWTRAGTHLQKIFNQLSYFSVNLEMLNIVIAMPEITQEEV